MNTCNHTPLFDFENTLSERIINMQSELNNYMINLNNCLNQNYLYNIIRNTIYCANSDEPETISGTLYLIGDNNNVSTTERAARSFRSIGVSCHSISAAGAMNGDIGVIKGNDIVLFVSKSGESLNYIMDYLYKASTTSLQGLSMFSVTMSECNNKNYKNFTLKLPPVKEMDDMNLLPTTSVLGFQIFFDLLLSEVGMLTGVTYNILGENHPSGKIGASIKTKD